MTYLQDKNKKDKKVRITLVMAFIAIAFLGNILNVFSISSLLPSISNKNSLTIEQNIESLKNENLSLKLKEKNYSILESRLNSTELNSELLSQTYLSVATRNTPLSLYGTFFLKTSTNISTTSIVLDKNLNAIGTISKSEETLAQVLLFWASKDGVKGNIIGKDLTLDFYKESRGVLAAKFPNTININIGDKVVLSENPSIMLGEIVDVTQNEKEPFKVAKLRSGGKVNSEDVYYIVLK